MLSRTPCLRSFLSGISPTKLTGALLRDRKRLMKEGTARNKMKRFKEGKLSYEQAPNKARAVMDPWDTSNPVNAEHVVTDNFAAFKRQETKDRHMRVARVMRMQKDISIEERDIWFNPSERILQKDKDAAQKKKSEAVRKRSKRSPRNSSNEPPQDALPRRFGRSHKRDYVTWDRERKMV